MLTREYIRSGTVAFEQSCRLSFIAGRATERGITAGRRRIAREAFALSLTDLLAWEEKLGAEGCAWVSDQLTAARQSAMKAGLLSADDICRIEREAIS